MSTFSKASFAAVILSLSSAAFAGGGPVTISPDHAVFAGYKCIAEDFSVSPANLRTPSIAKLRMVLQPFAGVSDTISAKIDGCNVTLNGNLQGGDSFTVTGLKSSCAAGEALLALLPVGTHDSSWVGNVDGTSFSNVLSIALDQEATAGACAEGSSAVILFGID